MMSSSVKRFFYGIALIVAGLVFFGCPQPTDPTKDAWDVTITPADHGEISANPKSAAAGTTIALTVSPESGYVLQAGSLKVNDGAVNLKGSGNNYTFTMPNGDARVDAVFEVLPNGHHPVYIPAFDNGTITVSPGTAAAGTTVALTVSADAGYGLKAGSISVKDADGVAVTVTGAGTAYTFIMPDKEVTVAAVFEALGEGIYSVSVGKFQGGVVSANPAQAEPDTAIILTVTPGEGYRLKEGSLKVNGGEVAASGNSYTFFMPQSHVTVTAEFELIPDNRHNVNIPAFDKGSVTAEPTRAEAGATVALTISPDGGYTLKEGTLAVTRAGGGPVDLNGSGTAYSFTMPDGDVAVAAEFEALPEGTYTVSIGQIQGGTINADPVSAKAGDPVTLTATAAAGYTLKAGTVKVNNGEVAVNGSGAAYTFTMPEGNVTVTAEFEAINYSISIGTLSNGGITANKGTATVGTTITLTVAPAGGYALKAGSLKVNNGEVNLSGSGNTYTFAMPAADATVGAEFEAINYSISIADMTNGGVTADKETATAGANVSLTIAPAAGYQLKSGFPKVNGGSVGGSGNTRTFVMPQGNVTVTAEFEAIIYSISIADMTNGSVSADPASAAAGTVVTLTVTPAEGYRLKAETLKANNGAVAVSAGSGTAHTFTMPQGNVTVTAVFEVLPGNLYAVRIDQGITHGRVEADLAEGAAGVTITLTVTPDAGYTLKADSLKVNNGAASLSGTGPYTFAMPAADVTVSAEFTAIVYNVTINSLTNGSVTSNPGSATVGTTVSLIVTPAAGYGLKADTLKVNNGAVSLSGTGPYTFAMPAGNAAVSAEFEKVSYNVTIGNLTNGDISASKQTATMGETIILTVTPGTGYELKTGTLKVNGTITPSPSNAAYTFAMPGADAVVTAEFELSNYAINIAGSVSHGDITANKGTAKMGETVSLTVTPHTGYALQGGSLKVNGSIIPSGSGPYTFSMPAADATVTAVFEAISYNVTVGSLTNGAITPDKQTGTIGETVTLTVAPAEGYRLQAGTLKVNGSITPNGSGPYTFAMPAAAVTVTAEFEAVHYAIAIDQNISNGSVIAKVGSNPATTATMGQTVTLTVSPEGDGYAYVADSLKVTKADNGAVTVTPGTEGVYTFAMPAANVTVTAQFAQSSLSLTADLGFPGEPNGHFGVAQTDWQGEGAAQSWTLTAGEEPTVYFAVSKGAGQTITVGGTNGNKAQNVLTAGATPEGFTVPALGNTIAVFAVDAADLIFDGNFDSGNPALVFTLLVEEAGKGSITYTVTLKPSLDAATTASIYQRKDGKWLKIRNPTFSEENVIYSGANKDYSGLKNIIYTNAPVTDLETAFAWVTFNAESGTGLNLVGGTTAGHSEYRIFFKADQQIGPIMVVYPSGREYVSLELYGAGSPGGVGRTITRNPLWNEDIYFLNSASVDTVGLISVISPIINSSATNIFILGKNVTLSGNDELTTSSAGLGAMGARQLLNAAAQNVILIMRDHAKITGYKATGNGNTYVPIRVGVSIASSVFYMEGGEISGNSFNTNWGVAFLSGYAGTNYFYKTGGTITGNTQDRVIQTSSNTVMEITTPPPGWPGSE
jgi:hypothetical protein